MTVDEFISLIKELPYPIIIGKGIRDGTLRFNIEDKQVCPICALHYHQTGQRFPNAIAMTIATVKLNMEMGVAQDIIGAADNNTTLKDFFASLEKPVDRRATLR